MEDGVFFRCFEPDDYKMIYKWHNDPEMMKDAVGMERLWSLQECKEWIEDRMKKNPFNFWYAVCLNNDSKQMIGYFGINNIHFVNRSATCNGIVIGEKQCRDGISWIQVYLYILYYVFEVLHLNRYYGYHLESQKLTSFVDELLFIKEEGRQRQAYFKNGKYIDGIMRSILSSEYFEHKQNGEYEMKNILKRIREIKNKINN